MDKAILLSIIFATILIPAIGARVPSARRGLPRTLVAMAIVVIIYVLALLFIAVKFIDTERPLDL